MRTLSLSVSDETYAMARVWVAEREISLRAIVEQLLCALPTIPRAIKAFPISTLSSSRSKRQNSAFLTQSISTVSTSKSAQNQPSQT
jgi:hypothetical protein